MVRSKFTVNPRIFHTSQPVLGIAFAGFKDTVDTYDTYLTLRKGSELRYSIGDGSCRNAYQRVAWSARVRLPIPADKIPVSKYLILGLLVSYTVQLPAIILPKLFRSFQLTHHQP